MQLATLIRTSRKSLQMNKQVSFNDSGVFAAAYCTTLVYGEGPSSLHEKTVRAA